MKLKVSELWKLLWFVFWVERNVFVRNAFNDVPDCWDCFVVTKCDRGQGFVVDVVSLADVNNIVWSEI